MRNPETREFMQKLYRLVEKYENPPEVNTLDDSCEYFKYMIKDVSELYRQCGKNEFALRLIVAFCNAVDDRFKAVNKQLWA